MEVSSWENPGKNMDQSKSRWKLKTGKIISSYLIYKWSMFTLFVTRIAREAMATQKIKENTTDEY